MIQKLYRDLKVPFKLRGAERVDDTPVHEALREALVNVLIHGDYTGRVPILILKLPGSFFFRNPGMMRLPLEAALDGGTSDCRNRNLQKMFQMAGLGEQAGSGIPKIYDNWKREHWRAPDLYEVPEPEHTILAMRMASLLPPDTLAELDRRFGARFRELSEIQRLALATVAIEGQVTHARIKQTSSDHPRDITIALAALVKDGFLASAGQSRGTHYFFPDATPGSPRGLPQASLIPDLVLSSRVESVAATSDASSEHLPPDSEHLPPDSEHSDVGPEHYHEAEALAEEVRASGKIARLTVERAILAVCEGKFITPRELAQILDRSAKTLRVHYLSKLIKEGRIEPRYPTKPNHPEQAYRTSAVRE
ncbi:MAG: ATP-binding protein [Candidatus Dormibacteraceae bacterium]